MEMVVYKYSLTGEDCIIKMNEGAHVLHLGLQQHPMGDDLCIWACVDPTKPLVPRRFVTRGTGQKFSTPLLGVTHIGTVQQEKNGGEYVWHVFEVHE